MPSECPEAFYFFAVTEPLTEKSTEPTSRPISAAQPVMEAFETKKGWLRGNVQVHVGDSELDLGASIKLENTKKPFITVAVQIRYDSQRMEVFAMLTATAATKN